jgi:ribosomal protein S12 methylthiotransferase accessory factor
LHLDKNNEENTRKYRCLQALLEIKWADDRKYSAYMTSLGLMYSVDMATSCLAIIEW